MELNINSPAYYTKEFGVDDEIYWMCRRLSALIENRFSDISERVEDIVTAMIASASRAYLDDCASEQIDIFVICETMDKLISESDPDSLFDSIIENLPEETPGQIFADIYFIKSGSLSILAIISSAFLYSARSAPFCVKISGCFALKISSVPSKCAST